MHTWSLAIEEHFYILFPACLLLVESSFFRFRVEVRRGALISVLWFGSLVAMIGSGPNSAFFASTSRFWELLTGVWLYFMHQRQSSFARSLIIRQNLKIQTAAVIAGVAALSLQPSAEQFNHLPVLLGIFCASAIIATGGNPGGENSALTAILSFNRLRAIGKLSCSLYLWHWPVFTFFRWTIGLHGVSSIAYAIAATIVLTTGSYFCPEQPLRYRTTGLSNRAILMAAFVAIFAVHEAAGFAVKNREFLSLSVVSKNAFDWVPSNQEARRKNTGSTEDFIGMPFSANTRVQIFVLGDSHASTYLSMLRRLYNESGIWSRIFQQGGCGVFPCGKRSPACDEFIERSTNEIENLARAGDIVFLPALRLPRISTQWSSTPRQEIKMRVSENRKEQLPYLDQDSSQHVIEFIRRINARGISIVFEAPKPLFPASPFRCADFFNSMNPFCIPGFEMPRDTLLNYRQPVMNVLEQFTKLPNAAVSLWDPFPVLCPSETCSAFHESTPLFFDGDHLSGYGSRLLVESFYEHLQTNRFVQSTQNSPGKVE